MGRLSLANHRTLSTKSYITRRDDRQSHALQPRESVGLLPQLQQMKDFLIQKRPEK